MNSSSEGHMSDCIPSVKLTYIIYTFSQKYENKYLKLVQNQFYIDINKNSKSKNKIQNQFYIISYKSKFKIFQCVLITGYSQHTKTAKPYGGVQCTLYTVHFLNVNKKWEKYFKDVLIPAAVSRCSEQKSLLRLNRYPVEAEPLIKPSRSDSTMGRLDSLSPKRFCEGGGMLVSRLSNDTQRLEKVGQCADMAQNYTQWRAKQQRSMVQSKTVLTL